MEDFSDRRIWRRLLAGEPRLFGVIWDRHRDRVFRHVLAHDIPRSEAEDLTAITFLELWRRRDAVRFVDDSVLPWLLVTAANVTRNAHRSARRYRALLTRLPLPEHVEDPAEVHADRQNERWLHARRVLSASRGDDRHLVMLTAVEGFSVREAAEAVGISESAAKMRLSRLRRRLAEPPSAVHLEGEPT